MDHRGPPDSSWNSLGPSSATRSSHKRPKRNRSKGRRHRRRAKRLTAITFQRNSQTVKHFSYFFRELEELQGAKSRAARRNVGARGGTLGGVRREKNRQIWKELALILACSLCLARRARGAADRFAHSAGLGMVTQRVEWIGSGVHGLMQASKWQVRTSF